MFVVNQSIKAKLKTLSKDRFNFFKNWALVIDKHFLISSNIFKYGVGITKNISIIIIKRFIIRFKTERNYPFFPWSVTCFDVCKWEELLVTKVSLLSSHGAPTGVGNKTST